MLDVGCTSGGFFSIMRSLEPHIEYTGIDISEAAIELAKQKHPQARFLATDGIEIPFEDNRFDLVHCTGVLVIEQRYKELLKDIANHPGLRDSRYRVQFEGEFQGDTVPYVISDADDVVNYILEFDPKPKALRGTGYLHKVSEMAETHFSAVCMTILLIQKGDSKTVTSEVDLQDLPIEFSIGPS